jgi:hypothetical protein
MRENTSAPITSTSWHAGAYEAVGHGQRIHEAAAHRLHVHRSASVVDAQLALHDASRAREAAQMVRRRCRQDDQVDVIGLQTGRFQRTLRGRYREVARQHIGFGVMARGNAAARKIHSSEVSIPFFASCCANSSLVTRLGGR